MKRGLVRTVAREVGRLLPRGWRLRASEGRAHALAARTRFALHRLAASGRPIIAGPYCGEVGFELLYWIPFLSWFAERYGVDRERIVAVSRGGAASWYTHLAGRYLDVFELIEPAEFRTRNAARAALLGEQKQVALTPFDEALVSSIRRRTDGSAGVLHPSLMYALFAPFWWGHLPIDWVDAHVRFRRLEPPPAPAGLALPDAFTAVKFYANDCFGRAPHDGAFARQAVRDLARHTAVVSLSTGLAIDDHDACGAPDIDVSVTQPGYEALTNLDVQSAIVARSRRFVGTYGGFAYLSPFFGVPATAFYSDPHGYARSHLDVARLAIARMGGGELDVRQAAGAPAAALGETVCSNR